jgi:hypothetical protein
VISNSCAPAGIERTGQGVSKERCGGGGESSGSAWRF